MYPDGFFKNCSDNGNDLASIFVGRDLKEQAQTAYGLNGTLIRFLDGLQSMASTLGGFLWSIFANPLFASNGQVTSELSQAVVGAFNRNWNTAIGPTQWIGRREIFRYTPDTQVAVPGQIRDHFFDFFGNAIERNIQLIPGEACEGRAVLLNFISAGNTSCKQTPAWLFPGQVRLTDPVGTSVHNTDYTLTGTVITAPYTNSAEEVRYIESNKEEILSQQLAPHIMRKVRDSILYAQEKAVDSGKLVSPEEASELPIVKLYAQEAKGNGRALITKQ